MHDSRFPRALRLLRKAEFRRVFDAGRSRADERLIVYACPRDEGGAPRLGLVVGRKFGPSVLRNRFKRRIRETFRLHRDELPPGHDLLVLPRSPALVPGPEEAAASLIETARRAARARARQGPRR